MKNVFNHLLAVLCLADLLVILTNIIHALKTVSGKPYPSLFLTIGQVLRDLIISAFLLLMYFNHHNFTVWESILFNSTNSSRMAIPAIP